jgi:hypothetical protein
MLVIHESYETEDVINADRHGDEWTSVPSLRVGRIMGDVR